MSCRTLPLVVAMAALLALASCGGPVAQSHDLLGIAASPQPLRERGLIACLLPNLSPSQIHDFAAAIAAQHGVDAWQYDPDVTPAQQRSDLAGWNSGGLLPEGPFPFSGSPRAFIVVAKDTTTQGDLLVWLSNRREVQAVVVYWPNGWYEGPTTVLQGASP